LNIRMPLDLQLGRKFEKIEVGTEIVMAWKEGNGIEGIGFLWIKFVSGRWKIVCIKANMTWNPIPG